MVCFPCLFGWLVIVQTVYIRPNPCVCAFSHSKNLLQVIQFKPKTDNLSSLHPRKDTRHKTHGQNDAVDELSDGDVINRRMT